MMAPAARLLVVMALSLASCGRLAPVAQPAAPASSAAAGAEQPLPQSLKPGRAVLVAGSGLVNGVPGFGRNALPALHGVYAYQRGTTQPVSVSVFYTTVRLPLAPPWKPGACLAMPAEYKGYTAASQRDGSTLWLLAAAKFSLVIVMPAEVADPCRFLAVFAERFSFFMRYAERPEDISFPAILETGP